MVLLDSGSARAARSEVVKSVLPPRRAPGPAASVWRPVLAPRPRGATEEGQEPDAKRLRPAHRAAEILRPTHTAADGLAHLD